MIPIGVRKNLVDWTRSRLTCASNLENYLFPLPYLAHVIRWLVSSCRGPYLFTYLSERFLIYFVTFWTDLGSDRFFLKKNSTHCGYQLIHVHANLFLVINFARKVGIDNTDSVWRNGKFVVLTIQLRNEFHVTVNLLRKWSHVTTKCDRKQKKWPTAQSSGHNSQTFAHMWNW